MYYIPRSGANHDQLVSMLSQLGHECLVIGLSEIKYRFEQASLLITEINGYTVLPQPSISNAGDAGIFMGNKLKFMVRDEVSVTTDGLNWCSVDRAYQ